MGWITPDYHYVTVTSNAGRVADPERMRHTSRSGDRHRGAGTFAVPQQQLRQRPQRPQTAAHPLQHVGRLLGKDKRPSSAHE